MKKALNARNKAGQFDFSTMTLICTCGHPLSVHAGENETKERPCFNEDCGLEGATGKSCKCKNFKKKI